MDFSRIQIPCVAEREKGRRKYEIWPHVGDRSARYVRGKMYGEAEDKAPGRKGWRDVPLFLADHLSDNKEEDEVREELRACGLP